MKKAIFWFLSTALVMAAGMPECLVRATEPGGYAHLPVTLNARDFIEKDLIQGENYRVEDNVKNDGMINTYPLSTAYGPLTVQSTAELLIRVNELKALVIMEEMDRKKVFGDALVSGVTGTVKGAAEFVKSPIDSGKNIIKGTGQFLSNLGQSIFSDDPDQDNVVKVALGYDVAKRQFAFEFGIDPYTDYDPVVNRLGEIARAAVAGGLTPKAAMAAVDHKVVLAMRISGTAYGMMQLVRDNPPAKLKEINREKLLKMGVDERLTEAFVDNYRYNPQEETLLVGELETMKGVDGLEIFVGRAALATGKTMALSYRIRAQMMAGYHANVAPVETILNIEGVLALQSGSGELVFLVPADFVAWTKALEGKADAVDKAIGKMPGVAGRELWVTGGFGKEAREGFESRGWRLVENANHLLLKND
jgi:hypothetical protein